MTTIDLDDDILSELHFQNRHNNDNHKIEIVENGIQYNTFFKTFIMKNLPCIIKNVSSDWNCNSLWVENGKINLEKLNNLYGELEAPIADCFNMEYNAHCKTNSKVSEFVNYMKQRSNKLFYLKDWHLKKLCPNDNFYNVPKIFASDWLNEYSEDQQKDDYMFVYVGPEKSWTSLHADVYSSYSWSVNIIGQKKWILFPPGEENKLRDKLGNLPSLFDPKIHTDINYYEVVQEKGDAIFVPSGWFHQVVNTLDTISINHNWINGCNLLIMWKALLENLVAVENEIDEFKNTEEYPTQCQLILKSVFGMDFKMFLEFVLYMGHKRLKQLQSGNRLGFGNYLLGINHIEFDLNSILNTMACIINHPLYTNTHIISLQTQNEFETLKHCIMLRHHD